MDFIFNSYSDHLFSYCWIRWLRMSFSSSFSLRAASALSTRRCSSARKDDLTRISSDPVVCFGVHDCKYHKDETFKSKILRNFILYKRRMGYYIQFLNLGKKNTFMSPCFKNPISPEHLRTNHPRMTAKSSSNKVMKIYQQMQFINIQTSITIFSHHY